MCPPFPVSRLGEIVAIHVPLGIVTGAIAMLSEKAPGRHPRFGTIYYWLVAAIFASATLLSIMRWEHNYHLFCLGFARLWRGTLWPSGAKEALARLG